MSCRPLQVAERRRPTGNLALVTARMKALVSGRVQGVGFRYWVRQEADSLELGGSATNLPDGRVEVIADGSRESCEALLAVLRSPGTPGQVSDVSVTWSEADGEAGRFRVR
jgi:acylphosphatase